MQKVCLSDLLDDNVITEGELRLILDITKDQLTLFHHKHPSGNISYRDKSKILTYFGDKDDQDLIMDMYKDFFSRNLYLVFQAVEEELHVPLLNFVENDIEIKTMHILDRRPKVKIKNLMKLNTIVHLK